MPTPDFNLYTKTGYFEDLIQRINRAAEGDRITLVTMSFDIEYPLIRHLCDSLAAAAGRGATVSLAVDAYNFLKGRDQFIGPLLLHRELPATMHGEFAAKYELIEQLRESGLTVAITNQPHRRLTNPYAGRSHIKFGIINDRVYLGGCNLDNPGHQDIMLGWKDAACAGQLYDFARQMSETESMAFMKGEDRTVAFATDMTVFVDAGKRRQSLILEQALELIDEAREHLLMTDQFFPNGETARRLLAAHKRGVRVTILYNHPSAFSRKERLPQYLNVAWSKLRLPAALLEHQLPRGGPYLHSKIIATESAAMVGSHNYIQAGVNFGTAEIALLCRDPAFSQRLSAFVQK